MTGAEDDPATALAALLRAETQALRQGQLAQLPGMEARRAQLMEGLAGARPGLPAMQALRAAAADNARAIDAALRGLRAARVRLTNLRRVAAGTTTYDAQGQRQGGGVASVFERRA